MKKTEMIATVLIMFASVLLITSCDWFEKETITEVILCNDADMDGFGAPTTDGCNESERTRTEVDTCPDVHDRNNDPASCADEPPPPPPPPADDADSDGVPDGEDNCVQVANAGQGDENGDGIGDACQERVNLFADINCTPSAVEVRIDCVSVVTDDRGTERVEGVERWVWRLYKMGEYTGLEDRTEQTASFSPPKTLACDGGSGEVFSVELTLHLLTTPDAWYTTDSGDTSFVTRDFDLEIPGSLCP